MDPIGQTDSFDPTAVTRGQDGTVKKDRGSGTQARDDHYSRPSYCKQPKPEFGTNEYILEAVADCGTDTVLFNEFLYARLNDMIVQAEIN